ncbi:MAG: SPOR domain-containing protein, partial [Candidatus Helarchaeota archaeon]|nr:SPOR domain-containing protein [Candidatus Helarchaeota archaeon]
MNPEFKNIFHLPIKTFFILSITASYGYSGQDGMEVYGKISETGSDVYRVQVVNAKSIKNARIIADKLNEMTNKPIYINSINRDFIVQVGGCSDINEANAVKNLLENLG